MSTEKYELAGWQHRDRPDMCSVEVTQLWIQVNPRHIENYIIPLYKLVLNDERLEKH